jgi:imidazoleglycerol-phosphate dehydratase
MNGRTAQVTRNTKETRISITMNLDGEGEYDISTGLPFLDHMLDLFARHALVDLQLVAKGDLAVDYHHTVEDIGLVIGSALDQALGDRTWFAIWHAVRRKSSILTFRCLTTFFRR